MDHDNALDPFEAPIVDTPQQLALYSIYSAIRRQLTRGKGKHKSRKDGIECQTQSQLTMAIGGKLIRPIFDL